jgi:hypothetical protein
MTVSLSSPVTGSAQTGLTSPTYTVVSDTIASNAPTKQYAVTALGGTQTNVDVHGASKPFTISFSRPANLRSPPVPNPNTGLIGNSPRNVFNVKVRKGTVPVTGQSPQVMTLSCDLGVVAGADLVEPEDIRAALSLLIGALTQVSSGLGDTLVSGLL